MLPHEREMVKKFLGKPFTILGINSDSSRSALKKIMDEQKITWPNIHGGPVAQNAIARRWNVTGWPKVYILDHEGVIRYQDLRGAEMERAVEELLKKIPEK